MRALAGITECVKRAKSSVTRNANNSMSQSELDERTCNWYQTREIILISSRKVVKGRLVRVRERVFQLVMELSQRL